MAGQGCDLQCQTSWIVGWRKIWQLQIESAIDQCLNKLLFYDLVWFHWQPVALCSNNAKSCYNCIVVLFAALYLCQLGTSTHSVFSMISMLHQMENHICTTFGNSVKNGSHKSVGFPIAGIGQGNGAGCQIWTTVSLPLFKLMNRMDFPSLWEPFLWCHDNSSALGVLMTPICALPILQKMQYWWLNTCKDWRLTGKTSPCNGWHLSSW